MICLLVTWQRIGRLLWRAARIALVKSVNLLVTWFLCWLFTVDDNFDIPLLSEVADSVNEQELQDIEKKIKSVKSRLGLLVDSDEEVKNENGGEAEITSTKQHQIEAEPSVFEGVCIYVC